MDGKYYQRGFIERRMGTGREIERQFKTRKLQYLGHLTRHNASKLQLLERKTKGRRSRGRPIITWITNLKTSAGAKYYQLNIAAEDGKRWHGLIVNLAQETTVRKGKVIHGYPLPDFKIL